ncbi:hypothetical protein KOW79_014247 [Hemibagrus wyckioides]|uniref:Uncharacterized protein n=1 Tax=Hemibagrus wyckioides TaxID=337641 RepID=A0A9D3NG79_9TELE|nr:uncharacterized protein LOC131366680 isoform X1 [Hemibagrus wyckioides]KAG7322901.1 hypothetical protein KOW79_014247 [Hemibagrus wyckioides]
MELVQRRDKAALCLWQVEHDAPSVHPEHVMPSGAIITPYTHPTTTEIINIILQLILIENRSEMRATGPVLLLVALAGCQSVFSASLEVNSKEDASDERVEISDLQKSDESEAEVNSEEKEMVHDNCFDKAERDQTEQTFNPTASSSSEEVTRDTETMSTKVVKSEDDGAEARVEVQIMDMAKEDSDEAEERYDIEVLKHAGERDATVE